MPDIETWENSTRGRVSVKKFDAQGKLKNELIGSGRKINLTPQERQLNQEMAASEEQDVFLNGALQPLRLLDGSEVSKEFASNPNHLSETDIKVLVKSSKTLDARLTQIKNPAALVRLLEAAHEADAAISTVEKIKARLAEVSPSMFDEVEQPMGGQSGQVVDPRAAGAIKAVTTR